MTNLTKPVYTLDKPNPSDMYPNSVWWLWLHLEALHPAGQLGGIYANKKGFHSPGEMNAEKWPTNYSIRDAVNRSGTGWYKASALDWTFPDAQRGDYSNIDKFSSRLLASSRDANDPRLDMAVYEWFGQADNDREVEGWNEYKEESSSSDSSHLWHIHFSFKRSKVGYFDGMWALLTVLMGWPVARWRESIGQGAATPAPPASGPNVPHHINGAHEVAEGHRATDVVRVQQLTGVSPTDGVFGPKTKAAVIAFQKREGLTADGIVGPRTWDALGY